MKKIEDIKNQEWEFTTPDLEKIKFLIEELTSLKNNKKINEEALRRIKNISREISGLEELCTDKIINLLKQHHMID